MMKAIVLSAFGSADQLSLKEVDDLAPGPGEVVVGVSAVAANFVDQLVIEGRYQFLPALPFSPGKGPAGVILRCGEGVKDLKPGDRVLAMAEQGGYAEQTRVAANQCYVLPDSMGFPAAASMSLCFDTAWFALRERARIRPGDTVLVLGASGAVGFACLQLARAMGARHVMAGVSSEEGAVIAREGGADQIIDLADPKLRDSLREQVLEGTGGHGADIVVDMLGDEIFAAAIRAVAWSGRLVVVGFAAGAIPTLKVNYLLVKNIEVTGLQISDYRKRRPELLRQCFDEVFQFFNERRIQPPPWVEYGFGDWREALRAVASRTTKKRIVLVNRPN
jgi:NADPH2:quinone reductase